MHEASKSSVRPSFACPYPVSPPGINMLQFGFHASLRRGPSDARGQPSPAVPEDGPVQERQDAEGERPGNDGLPSAGGRGGCVRSSPHFVKEESKWLLEEFQALRGLVPCRRCSEHPRSCAVRGNGRSRAKVHSFLLLCV